MIDASMTIAEINDEVIRVVADYEAWRRRELRRRILAAFLSPDRPSRPQPKPVNASFGKRRVQIEMRRGRWKVAAT